MEEVSFLILRATKNDINIVLDYSKAVFSASELPYFYPLGQHIEMSFLPAPPKEIFFCCLIPPSSVGGETTLCDFAKVYRDLDPDVRRRFEEKGVGKPKQSTDPTVVLMMSR